MPVTAGVRGAAAVRATEGGRKCGVDAVLQGERQAGFQSGFRAGALGAKTWRRKGTHPWMCQWH